MTRDDVIRMAREADLWLTSEERIAAVERFAKLVVAHEREECAKACDELAELNRRAFSDSMWQQGECAAALRARGQS